MTSNNKIFGLIGKTLSHSFSANYFNNKFLKLNLSNTRYELFSLEDLNDLFFLLQSNASICGLNVTVPYKTDIIQYLDEVDQTATVIGAVNTIKIDRTQSKIILRGYNTDYLGFSESLKHIAPFNHKKALILGSGGAAKAVAFALNLLKIEFLFVSRTVKNINTIGYNELNLDIIENHSLIINTTPLGMFPNIEEYPDIPYQYLNNKHFLYDLVYNPELSNFLKKGKEQNAYICNGLKMLFAQADYAWKIWNNETI